MTREEAKTVFLNRGYVEVEGGTIYDPDKWREACRVISEWLEQEPKTGHWIERRSRATGHIESVCSKCGAEEGYPYNNYCGNCGTKMFEPQESEKRSDKE